MEVTNTEVGNLTEKMNNKVHIESLPGDKSVLVALFSDVVNCSELKSLAMEGRIAVALLSCKPVIDIFQILSAAYRAVHNERHERLTTRNVHSEILYSLSASKNITDSFRKFGMSDDDNAVILALISSPDQIENEFERIASFVKGRLDDVSDIGKHVDEQLVKKLYKVKDVESRSGSLLDAVITRMACKEIVAL